jgi:hypothetical protein
VATRIASEFLLIGVGFNPDEITALLEIQPTGTWRLGDLVPRTALRRKHDAWFLSTGYENLDDEHSIDVMSQARCLFDRLQPATAKLIEICTRLKLESALNCVLYIEGNDRPAVYFEPYIVQWLAQLHAEIDIDLYYLPRKTKK